MCRLRFYYHRAWFRALHGTDATKNAVHGSDSFSSALREVKFCFNRTAEATTVAAEKTKAAQLETAGERQQHTDVSGDFGCDGFAKEQKTLALLKPGVSELHSGEREREEERKLLQTHNMKCLNL